MDELDVMFDEDYKHITRLIKTGFIVRNISSLAWERSVENLSLHKLTKQVMEHQENG